MDVPRANIQEWGYQKPVAPGKQKVQYYGESMEEDYATCVWKSQGKCFTYMFKWVVGSASRDTNWGLYIVRNIGGSNPYSEDRYKGHFSTPIGFVVVKSRTLDVLLSCDTSFQTW